MTAGSTSGGGVFETATALVRFFVGRGCVPLPAADPALPAGVVHPESFFRLLARGPWRAACVQPVFRPLDARPGRHPTRLARHVEVEAVIQGPPDDAAGLLAGAFAAAGLAAELHDLRWAEANWTSQPLAAWGIGWAIAVDGVSVARLVTVVELAERKLETPALLLTVGVERLAMRIAGAPGIGAVAARDGGPAWGEIGGPSEAELARYATTESAAEPLRRQLAALEEESARCLEAGLVRLAYARAAESLTALDLLTARGELDPRDRDRQLSRVRALVLAAAERYLADGPDVAPLLPEPEPPLGHAVGEVVPSPVAPEVEAATVEASTPAPPKTRKPRRKRREKVRG